MEDALAAMQLSRLYAGLSRKQQHCRTEGRCAHRLAALVARTRCPSSPSCRMPVPCRAGSFAHRDLAREALRVSPGA